MKDGMVQSVGKKKNENSKILIKWVEWFSRNYGQLYAGKKKQLKVQSYDKISVLVHWEGSMPNIRIEGTSIFPRLR